MKGINMKIINITCAFLALAVPSFAADFTLYNVMPFSPGREVQCAADCREYRDRTGCDLVLYSLTLHPEGKPAMEKVERYVASYRALRRELDGSGVLARARKGGGSIVLAVNLNSEPINAFRLRAPGATDVSVLGPDGTWHAVPFTSDGEWLSLSTDLAFCQARVFKVDGP